MWELNDVNGVSNKRRSVTLNIGTWSKVIWNAAHKKSQVNINSTIKENAMLYIFFFCVGKTLACSQHTVVHPHFYFFFFLTLVYFTIPNTSDPIYSLLNNSQCEMSFHFVPLYRWYVHVIKNWNAFYSLAHVSYSHDENASHRHTITICIYAFSYIYTKHPAVASTKLQRKALWLRPGIVCIHFLCTSIESSQERSITTIFSLHSMYIVSDFNRSLFLGSLIYFFFLFFIRRFFTRCAQSLLSSFFFIIALVFSLALLHSHR